MVRRGRQCGGRLGPGHYLEVRYEELTIQPEPTIRSILDFLGLGYESLIESHFSKSLQDSLVASDRVTEYLMDGINQSRSFRWTREMARRDVAFYQAVSGHTLRALGYEILPDGTNALTGTVGSLLWGVYQARATVQRYLRHL